MSARPMKKRTDSVKSRTDYARLDAMKDEDIDFSDNPATTKEFWKDAQWIQFVVKTPVNIRLDGDVLRWFKDQGPRYQSRMNAVLRAYMEHNAGKEKSGKLPKVNKLAKKKG